MFYLTDLTLTPGLAPQQSTDWQLSPRALGVLGRVAATSTPILYTECSGAAFERVLSALHRHSGRDQLLLVDLRKSGGALPADLPLGERAARATLALDGIEHLASAEQLALACYLEHARPRLVSATDADLAALRRRWRPDLIALLSAITMRAPGLARRGAEVPALAVRRLALLALELGLERDVPQLAGSALEMLAAHEWTGGIAELDAVLLRSLIASEGAVLEAGDLCWEPQLERWPGVPGTEAISQVGRSGTARRGDESEQHVPETAGATAEGVPSAGGPEPAPPPDSPSPTLEALAVELAHQLKNPLVTVKTFVANAESLCEAPEELAQFRVLTEEAVTRMDEILDGLLSFSRLGPTSGSRVDVLPVLRDALRGVWRAFASKQVTLEAPEDASLPVRGDLEHLRFALAMLSRHVAETIEARSVLAIAIEPGSVLRLTYRESGAITHLRGAANASDDSLPLALLLVRGALGRVGGALVVTLEDSAVLIRLRLAPP